MRKDSIINEILVDKVQGAWPEMEFDESRGDDFNYRADFAAYSDYKEIFSKLSSEEINVIRIYELFCEFVNQDENFEKQLEKTKEGRSLLYKVKLRKQLNSLVTNPNTPGVFKRQTNQSIENIKESQVNLINQMSDSLSINKEKLENWIDLYLSKQMTKEELLECLLDTLGKNE